MNLPAVGSMVTTMVHSIGGRQERVTGKVVDHWRQRAVVVETKCHGRLVVDLDKLERGGNR